MIKLNYTTISNYLRGSLVRIEDHKLDVAHQVESPNQDGRPDNEISLIVVHCISLPAGHFGGNYVESLFCNQLNAEDHPDLTGLIETKVSSHLYIRRTGDITQFVPFNQRAWHAGESSYENRTGCNDFSIGIELEGTDTSPYTDKQYESLIRVCTALIGHYEIEPDAITGHSDIAPGRKTDPGGLFDWVRLRNGIKSETG